MHTVGFESQVWCRDRVSASGHLLGIFRVLLYFIGGGGCMSATGSSNKWVLLLLYFDFFLICGLHLFVSI